MEASDVFNLIHNALEAKNRGRKISHADMAKRLNISMRTYQDWRLGKANPKAAVSVIEMLSWLSDDEMISVIKRIKNLKENSE